ncbi:MAG TPA: hypothetical protein V6C98_13855 [Thermosynechococcaceae cyanobacterium]|jgi:hypothetical protein
MTTAYQVESLAKLYLESQPAQLSDTMLAELCDWLWGELQKSPFNQQGLWYARYNSATELLADLQPVSHWKSAEHGDNTLALDPIYSFIFQAMHDKEHQPTRSDFSLAREIATYNTIAKRVSSLNVQKMLYSANVLRAAAYLFLGHAPLAKMVFP